MKNQKRMRTYEVGEIRVWQLGSLCSSFCVPVSRTQIPTTPIPSFCACLDYVLARGRPKCGTGEQGFCLLVERAGDFFNRRPDVGTLLGVPS